MKTDSSIALAKHLLAALVLVAPLQGRCVQPALPSAAADTNQQIERGRYLVRIGGCNDCHTPGYAAAGGQAPLKQWLVGDRLGMQGPWGTTYPSNLRMLMVSMNEQQWVQHARSMQPRPPMPWFNVRAMNDDDLRAIYAFVRSLGPAGEPAPAALPPGAAASGPVIRWPG